MGFGKILGLSVLLMGPDGRSAVQGIDPMTRRQMAISIAATDERVPPPEIIEILEATLSKNDCVGQIRKWNRRYAFGLDRRFALSTDKIVFALKRVPVGIRTVRKAVPYGLFPELDDAVFDRVDGYYVPSSRSLKITYCGPNRRRPSKGV